MGIRNKLNIECPRARGAFLEEVPQIIWTEPGWVLEPKEDGERVTQEIRDTSSLFVGRNRQDFLKGVDKAGMFRHQTGKHPELEAIGCPDLAGTVLDGERTETFKSNGKWDKYTERRFKKGLFLGYTVWDCLFIRGKDVRHYPLETRRKLAQRVIGVLNHPKIILIPQYPAKMEVLEDHFDLGWEGMIGKNLLHPIPLTQRTHTGWWKLKGDKGRTVDGFVTGVTEALAGGSGLTGIKPQPNGCATTFTMSMMCPGSTMEVAKMYNLPPEAVADGLQKFEKFKNRVAEFTVSGWDGERFRWPRFSRWRNDKSIRDCLFGEQVDGTC